MCVLICGFGGVCVFFFPIFQMKFDSSFYPLDAVRIPLQYDEVSPPLSLRTCVHGRVPFFISIKKNTTVCEFCIIAFVAV